MVVVAGVELLDVTCFRLTICVLVRMPSIFVPTALANSWLDTPSELAPSIVSFETSTASRSKQH